MTAESPVILNAEDPFEAVIADIVALNRRKRADYALDSDPWSNFRQTAAMVSGFGHDFGPLDAVLFNIAQKIVRLQALAVNDRAPSNEAVSDTWQDMAVYSIIGMVLAKEQEAPTQEISDEALEQQWLGRTLEYGEPEPHEHCALRSRTGLLWRGEPQGWRWHRDNGLDDLLGLCGAGPVLWGEIVSGEFPMTVESVRGA